MSSFIDILKNREGFMHGVGATDESINDAENALGLVFSQEYKEYLKAFGVAAFDGHELTGLSETDRLNVVSVTKAEKTRSSKVPEGLYVIERTGYEGIIIWQSESGGIYYSSMSLPITKLHDSLSEYISK